MGFLYIWILDRMDFVLWNVYGFFQGISSLSWDATGFFWGEIQW